jgi:Transposase DDE domain.
VPLLPPSVKNVLLDSGYDDNDLAEAVEYHRSGKPTGRHYLCPLQARGGKPAVGQRPCKGWRKEQRLRRAARQARFASKRGRELYQLRRRTIEPFHQWFKQLFELQQRVWHYGLDNNRTMLLAAIFCYQVLLRYVFRQGQRNAQVQWVLDAL